VAGVNDDKWVGVHTSYKYDPDPVENAKNLCSGFRIRDASFEYYYGETECITGHGEFDVSGKIKIEASLAFTDKKLNEVAFSYKPKKPIKAGPLLIEKIYGAVCNIFTGSADCPVIKWNNGKNLCWSERTGKRCVRASVDYRTVKTGLRGSPLLTIYETYAHIKDSIKYLGLHLGSGEGTLKWSGSNKGLDFSGKWDPNGGVYEGSLSGKVGYDNSNFSGKFKAAGKIPSNLHILAGKTFAQQTFTIHSNGELSTGFDLKACEITISINKDGRASFDVEVPWNPFSWFRSRKINQKTGKVLYNSLSTTFDITENKPFMVSLSYDNPSGNPAFTLQDPNSNLNTPDNSPFNSSDKSQYAYYLHNNSSQDATYIIPDPATGTYTVELLYPETLGNYEMSIFQEPGRSFFDINSVSSSASSFSVTWDDDDPASTATVELYLSPDRGTYKGELFAGPILLSDTLNTYSHDLITSPVPAGSYWIMARIYENSYAAKTYYSGNMVEVINPLAPPAVSNVQVFPGHGEATVTWNPVPDSENIDMYRIEWTDELNESTYKYMQSADPDEESALIKNLIPGRTYRFTVKAIRIQSSDPAKRFLICEAIDEKLLQQSEKNNRLCKSDIKLCLNDMSLGSESVKSLLKQVEKLQAPDPKTFPKDLSYIDNFLSKESETLEEECLESPELYSETITIPYASGINHPPEIHSYPVLWVSAGNEYSYDADISDPENDPLSCNLMEYPTGMTVSESGLITWNTTLGDAGLTTVTLEVDDGSSKTYQSWILAVTDLPVPQYIKFISQPETNIVKGQNFEYNPKLKTSDQSSSVNFDLIQSPAQMTIDAETGSVSWPKEYTLVPGDYPVTIRARQNVSYGKTIETTQYFVIDVEWVRDTSIFEPVSVKLEAAGATSTVARNVQFHAVFTRPVTDISSVVDTSQSTAAGYNIDVESISGNRSVWIISISDIETEGRITVAFLPQAITDTLGNTFIPLCDNATITIKEISTLTENYWSLYN